MQLYITFMMKLNRKLNTAPFIAAFMLIIFCSIDGKSQQKNDEMNIGEMIQPLTNEGIFRDPDFYNWGNSIIKDEDNKYHLFYSRWPREYGFFAWLTHSEIAHAIADQPEGPYQYKETVIQGRGGNYWDAITAHNPKIKYFEGMYYLYYIGTHSNEKYISPEELIETANIGYSHSNWSILRNNQRTGVAVAGSIHGPWKRFDSPIVEPEGPITTLTVNPAITRGPEGKYYLIVKGDKPNETRFIRNQAIATAHTPVGPFTIESKPVIDYLDTEDVSMWFSESNTRFYAVFHAHTFIGLITSEDGFNWKKADNYKVTDKKILKNDGTFIEPDRMERPFVFIENGSPRVFSLAIKKGDDSYSVFISLKKND